jgi:hypothetical protein
VLGPGPMHRKNGEIDWPLWQCCWPARSDHRPGRAGLGIKKHLSDFPLGRA